MQLLQTRWYAIARDYRHAKPPSTETRQCKLFFIHLQKACVQNVLPQIAMQRLSAAAGSQMTFYRTPNRILDMKSTKLYMHYIFCR